MRTLSWSARALADLARIREFNEMRSLTWADNVEARMRTRAESLSGLPRQGRRIGGELHQLSIPDIQYVLIYAITNDVVSIVEVWSTRENRESA